MHIGERIRESREPTMSLWMHTGDVNLDGPAFNL